MKIFHTISEMQQYALAQRRAGRTIALVPTMGYLHNGHASLIDIAAKKADEVFVSIFVNPIQFAPNEDLDKYPRDFERDKALCEAHGATAIFAPTPQEMYFPDASIFVDENKLSKVLCGKTRPIHFRGVLTVVNKLFNIAQCNVAVFGRKDAQQAILIKRMVRDLNLPVEIILGDLIRDTDQVAMSSRNRYLSETERRNARSLSRNIFAGKAALEQSGIAEIAALRQRMIADLEASGGKVDYVEVLDAENLAAPTAKSRELLLAGAVYFGATRLIDNAFVRLK